MTKFDQCFHSDHNRSKTRIKNIKNNYNTMLTDLPVEVIVKILSHSCPFPSRLKFRHVCRMFRSIIDGCFRTVGVVNLERYWVLNRSFDLQSQMKYLIDDCHKVIEELVVTDTLNALLNHGMTIRTQWNAASVVINQQPSRLTSLSLTIRNDFDFADDVLNGIDQCFNLKNLDIGASTGSYIRLDVSNLTNLRTLKGTGLVYRRCRAALTELQYCNVDLVMKCDNNDMLEMLLSASPTLEYFKVYCLSVESVTELGRFKCPRLKSIDLKETNGARFIFDLTQSVDLEALQLERTKAQVLANRSVMFKLDVVALECPPIIYTIDGLRITN